MDGQNFENNQSVENQGSSQPQYSSYQDNTSTYSYQTATVVEDASGANKANGLQIAGLVLGIISIVICCCYGVPSIILGIIGMICAIMGNKENKHSVGTAGLVCSIIGLILGIIMLVLYVAVVGAAGGMQALLNDYNYYY